MVVCFVSPLCLVASGLGTIDPFTSVRKTCDNSINRTFPDYISETLMREIVASAKCYAQVTVMQNETH